MASESRSKAVTFTRLRPLPAYALSLGLTFLVVAVQHYLPLLSEHAPFLAFYLAVFLAALLGGRGPGMLALVAGALNGNYHFLQPQDQFTTTPEALAATGLFALVGSVVGELTARLSDDRRALASLVIQLEHARAKAEEEARLRERLVAIVGHDLRQPLSVIATGSTLLGRFALEAQARTLVDQLQRNSRRMNSMIEDLLDFTRSKTFGTLPVSRREVELNELCRRAVEDARVAYPEREFVLQESEVAGPWDADRIQQVLSNLLANACAHGDPHAPVSVRVARQGDEARLEVHNRGVPIPEDLKPVIFEPFRRGDARVPSTGLGLGLYIVREIARAHGGTVELRSTEREGTTFCVRLPLALPVAT